MTHTPPTPERLRLELALFDEEAEAAALNPSHKAGNDKRSVLIVDDDPDMRLYLQDCLEDTYHVTPAEDGLTALRLARARPPDVMVSDVMMPGLDGYALCQAVKTDALLRDVPVLLVSGEEPARLPDRAREAGADGFLVKPFNAQALHDAVYRLLPPPPRTLDIPSLF